MLVYICTCIYVLLSSAAELWCPEGPAAFFLNSSAAVSKGRRMMENLKSEGHGLRLSVCSLVLFCFVSAPSCFCVSE